MIIFNGCSFTYGDELPGSRHPAGFEHDTHAEHTYAHKLADMLGGMKYVNLAQNGSSNDKIFRRTMLHLYTTKKPIDLLVVQWSSFGRFELVEPKKHASDLWCQNEGNVNQVHFGIKVGDKKRRPRYKWAIGEQSKRNDILKDYVENVLTVETSVFQTLCWMVLVQRYCEMMCIPVIQHHTHPSAFDILMNIISSHEMIELKRNIIQMLTYLPASSRVGLGKFESISGIAVSRHYGLYDCGHPKEGAHTHFAKMLYERVIPELEIGDGKGGVLEDSYQWFVGKGEDSSSTISNNIADFQLIRHSLQNV